MPGTVYSLGSILVDLTVDLPALPERGGDVIATGTRIAAGGGFNVAAAVARQGIRCVYGGPHGTGPYGDTVRAALTGEGVEIASPTRTDGDTGFCITLVEAGGERTFVTVPGVDAELRSGELGRITPQPAAGTDHPVDVVSVSGYDLAYPASGPVLADWLDALPDGVAVALDPGPLVLDIPAERLRRVLPRLAVLTVNQREARLLAAGSAALARGAGLLAAVRRVNGVRSGTLVVVREGADGCVAAGGVLGEQAVTAPAPAVAALDSTGAGDTHTGVLLAALATGRDGRAALRLANRAAAISVTRLGPAAGPGAAELAAWRPTGP